MTTSKARQAYVNAVVANFVRLPGTPLRASRRDRRLAAALHDRGVPLRAVCAAFVIAGARWAIRSPVQRKLEQIRTLYYFVPAIEEVLAAEPETEYVCYLAARLRPFLNEKAAILASSPLSQKAAFLAGR